MIPFNEEGHLPLNVGGGEGILKHLRMHIRSFDDT